MRKSSNVDKQSQVLPLEFLGTFGTDGCTIELNLEQDSITGYFDAGGELLGVYPLSQQGGVIEGLLKEPLESSTIAVFRARVTQGGMLLELDLPDPDEQPDFSGAQRILLHRIQKEDPLAAIPLGGQK